MINSIRNIYEHLQDDISRQIFASRLNYNVTDNIKYLREILEEMNKIYDVFPDFAAHADQEKIIFGAGDYGRQLKRLYPEIEWNYFVDNNIPPGSYIDGVPVISFDDFEQKHRDAYVLISSRHYYKEMEAQCEQENISHTNVYSLGGAIDYMMDHQYFDVSQLPHVEDEIFVDCGVCDGKTSQAFIKWSNRNFKHIYMFEPNKNVHKGIVERFSGENNWSLIPCGVWDSKTQLHFSVDMANAGSSFCAESFGKSVGEEIVDVVDMDGALKDVQVTFLKMDIEGAEMKALEGARGIITKNKPKVAISIYHKPEDVLDIPRVLLEYNPSYKFYIRHYSLLYAETVLYAI